MASNTPDFLVKYCSASTGATILNTRTLRWSAPNLYGDPFELNHTSSLNFDPHILLQAACQTAIGMVFSKDSPKGSSPLLNVIRRWRTEERFASPEEAEEVLRDLLSRMVDSRQTVIDKLMADWRQFSRSVRICSFSTKADNLSSWDRFADRHRGIAIRFACGDDTQLVDPQPVRYKKNRPEITNLKEQLGCILHNESFDAQDHFIDNLCLKPTINSDEQEWRLFNKSGVDIDSDDQKWFDDKPFERAQISAIYLGACMSAIDKRSIYNIAKEHYPKAKVFQSKIVSGKYEVEFERITKK